MTQFVTHGVQITGVMNNIQPDRESPKQTLKNIRNKTEKIVTNDLPKENDPLEYTYFYLTVLNIKQSTLRKRQAFIKLVNIFDNCMKSTFRENNFRKMRDACYANFQDLLDEYEKNHPKTSSRHLKDILRSVPTTTLWVMKNWDPEAMRHFEVIFKSSYKLSFNKLLDQVLNERGITSQHNSQESAIKQLTDILRMEQDDLKSGHTFQRKKIEISSESSSAKTESDEDESQEEKTDNFKQVPRDVIGPIVYPMNRGNDEKISTKLKAFWNKFNCLN